MPFSVRSGAAAGDKPHHTIMDESRSESAAESHQPSSAAESGPLVYQSEELLANRREVLIEHEGQMYRLRVTAKGRLYLTK